MLRLGGVDMKKRLLALSVLGLVILAGCTGGKSPASKSYAPNLVVESITEQYASWSDETHWHIVVSNVGNSSADIRLVFVDAYNSLGEKVDSTANPGKYGYPMDGLLDYCQDGSCVHYLFSGDTASMDVFRGVEGITKIRLTIYYDDYDVTEVLFDVPYHN